MIGNKLADLTASEVVDRLQVLMNGPGGSSLIEYTQVARVEPVTLVDTRIMHQPYIGDVLQTLSSVFAGYYLQAIALSTNVGNVNTLRLLDKLNPNRSPKGRAFDYMLTMEAYQHRLPRPSDVSDFGLENDGRDGDLNDMFDPRRRRRDDRRGREYDRRGRESDRQRDNRQDNASDGITDRSMSSSFGRDTVKMAQEVSALSVGKLLEVTIKDGDRSAVFPISLRLMVSAATPDVLTHTLAVGSAVDKTMKERFHAWRSGQLRFIRDLIFCQDLIDDHRKNLIRDKSGNYQRTLERRNKNRLTAVITGAPSLATASNLYVISEQTARELENKIGGKLMDFKTRENVFKETYGMILTVVDTEWEQVTMFHRSIDAPTTFSIKELKRINRGTGPDVMEILRAYQMGQNPSI